MIEHTANNIIEETLGLAFICKLKPVIIITLTVTTRVGEYISNSSISEGLSSVKTNIEI